MKKYPIVLSISDPVYRVRVSIIQKHVRVGSPDSAQNDKGALSNVIKQDM